MKLDKNEIKQALQFYDIEDKEYLNKCYECLDSINTEEQINRVKEVYAILYYDETNKIQQLWKIDCKEDIFGDNCHPYITSILVLLGHNVYLSNIKKIKFDKEQISIHKKRIKECLTRDIYERKLDGISIRQMLWASYFINAKIIEVGRLQFDFNMYNPLSEEKENCIKIHIPKSDSLSIEEVKQCINDSKTLVKKYFNLENPNYYCKSWLLSRQIRDMLDSNSNIIKFQNIFDIEEAEECTKDILNFVFNAKQCNNYKNLREDTSLQRKIKQHLIDGKIIKYRYRNFKKGDLKWMRI